MNQPIVISTTCDDRMALVAISNELLNRKLAACCQISGPMQSIYRWQDQVSESQEWLCTIKSVSDNYSEVESSIRANHPYDEPEIIATEITAGSQGYLDWVRVESSGPGSNGT